MTKTKQILEGGGCQLEEGKGKRQFSHLIIFSLRVSPDGQYPNQIDYILCSQKWRSSTQSAKSRLGADCGSDLLLLLLLSRFSRVRLCVTP